MGRRSRKSKRRINSLKLSVLLCAVLLIASSYAWFSANRVVSIEDITARVVAAEGLQISLDGETWGASVSATEANLSAAKAKATGLNNYLLPTALEPVSTTGTEVDNGALKFLSGMINSDGSILEDVKLAAADSGKYMYFDVYLKNSSSKTSDDLQLNNGSKLIINQTNGVADTGLEMSARVGFVLYGGTAGFTAPLTADDNSGIAQISSAGAKVSIWEPNYNNHISEVVKNDSTRIPTATTDFTTFGLLSAATGATYTDGGETKNGVKPANGSSAIDGITLATNTVKTAYTEANGTGIDSAYNLVSATDGTTKLTLAPNKIMKMKVYIWLEGQDPDCIDTASTGKQFDVVINLAKPGSDAADAGAGG